MLFSLKSKNLVLKYTCDIFRLLNFDFDILCNVLLKNESKFGFLYTKTLTDQTRRMKIGLNK